MAKKLLWGVFNVCQIHSSLDKNLVDFLYHPPSYKVASFRVFPWLRVSHHIDYTYAQS